MKTTYNHKQARLGKYNFYFAIVLVLILIILANVNIFAQDGTEWGYSASTLTSYSFANIEKKEIPIESKLYQNFPNPCYTTTSIKFDLSSQTNASLTLSDMSGNAMKTYNYNNIRPGSYEIKINASNLEAGLYTYKFVAGTYSEEYQMTVVK